MKNTSFLIVGKHAVTEALKNPNRVVLRVFLTEDSKKTLNRENQSHNLHLKFQIFYKTKKELDHLCSKEKISHQGLIAEIKHIEENNLKDFIKTINSLHVVIDCLKIPSSKNFLFPITIEFSKLEFKIETKSKYI